MLLLFDVNKIKMARKESPRDMNAINNLGPDYKNVREINAAQFTDPPLNPSVPYTAVMFEWFQRSPYLGQYGVERR